MPHYTSVKVRVKALDEKAVGLVASRLAGLYSGAWGGRVLNGNDGDFIAWVELSVKVEDE